MFPSKRSSDPGSNPGGAILSFKMQEKVKLNKFKPEDKEIFDKAYSSLEFPLAEHSFAWIYIWDYCYNDIQWAKINGNLCLFLNFLGNRYIWGPALPGINLPDTLRKCFELCEQYNKEHKIKGKPSVKYIPEELKEKYSNIHGYKLVHQNQDYIYKREDIIELKGDKYKSKRNLRNYFIKNYKYKVGEYEKDKHMKECVEVLDKWEKQKLNVVNGEHHESLDDEYDANLKVLELAEMFGLKGVVAYVDDKIQGYTFGEQTNKNMCTDFFEKTNLDIKGLSVFIYGELLKIFEGNLVNAGEDWGVDYLRTIKLSYHPIMIRKSYTLEKA